MALEQIGLYKIWNKDEFEERFEAADLDKDGSLDKEEVKTYIIDLLDKKL